MTAPRSAPVLEAQDVTKTYRGVDGGDVRVRVNDPAPGRVTLIGPSEHVLSTTAVLHA